MKDNKITLKYCFKNFKNVFLEVVSYIKKTPLNKSFKTILEILALILLICIIHAPFGLLYSLIVSMLNSREITGVGIMNVIYFVTNFLYIVFAVIVFIRIFVERYEKLNK